MDSLADASGAMKRKRSPSDVLPPQSRPAPSTPSTAAPSMFPLFSSFYHFCFEYLNLL